MKPLSEQLAELSQRAKKAEDDAKAARTEEHAKIKEHADRKADRAEENAFEHYC
jgi:hypothetical protein